MPFAGGDKKMPTDFTGLLEWVPVSEPEIRGLITSLSSRRSLGEDMFPQGLFKAFPDQWAPVLARVFSQINGSGLIPSDWKLSVVVPIHKKGDKSDLQNYRPVSLLEIAAKLYSKYL